jgi:hypothetical protein
VPQPTQLYIAQVNNNFFIVFWMSFNIYSKKVRFWFVQQSFFYSFKTVMKNLQDATENSVKSSPKFLSKKWFKEF